MNQVIQGTVKELESKYKDLSDDEIIWEIRAERHAGEALFYLLFGRYASMLEMIFSMQVLTSIDFDDFMLELDIRLFKDHCLAIKNYHSDRASFKTYLSTIARNLLYDLREKDMPTLDEEAVETALFYHSDSEAVITLVEEINSYPNKDARYVLFKTIEGYKSKEIAAMLTSRRHEEGTLEEEKILTPNTIDAIRSRALKAIRRRIEKQEEPVCRSMVCPSAAMDMDSYSMSDMEMTEPMPMESASPAMPISVAAGLFMSNISDLYNEMMED